MRNKYFAVLVGVLLLALVGSAVPGATAPTKTFTFWTWGDERFFKEGFDMLVAKYPEYKDVQWTVGKTGSGGEHLQKLLVSYSAKSNLPDVAELNSNAIGPLARAGVLLDLTDRFKPYRKDFSEAAIRAVTYGGRVYAVPWNGNSAMIFYRKDILETAGIDPTKIETWDDFIAAGKRLTSYTFPDGKKRYMINVDATKLVRYPFEAALTELNGHIFDPETGQVVLDKDPGAIKAMKLAYELGTSGIAVRMDTWSAPWDAAIDNGTFAALIVYNWMDQILQQDHKGTVGKWVATSLPAFERGGNRYAVPLTSTVMAVSTTPDKEMVWRFMETAFLNPTNPVTLDKHWQLTPIFGPAQGDPFYSQPSAFYGGEKFKALDIAIMKRGNYLITPPAYLEANSYILNELLEAVNGKKTIDAAIKDAAATLRQKIGGSR